MRKLLRNSIFLWLCISSLYAQQPARYELLGTFKKATELFDKAKYGAAAEQFGLFLEANQAHDRTLPGESSDLLADAQFYRALCAFNLLNGNTQALFYDFIRNNPSHPRVDEARFYIGRLHFIKREYDEALPPLEELDSGNLPEDLKVQARFYQGYCYYNQGNTKEALSRFRQIRTAQGEYGEMGAYYFAVLSYEQGNYSEAYEAFERIGADSEFAKGLEVYKASCLLKLERFDELDAMGKELLRDDTRASHEVWFVFGNAAYEREEYAKCIEYFEKFERQRGSLNREGMYRMGISYFRTRDFANAMKRLERVITPEDAIAQSAYYYLGQSFLKIENYDNARTAFRQAAELDFDRGLSEEALFQYTKTCFATRYFEDALAGLQTFLKEYPESKYTAEANGMVGEILLYTNNFKDAIEYLETKSDMRSPRTLAAYQRACYYYGHSLFDKQLYEQAAEHYKKAYNQRQDAVITLSSYYWYAEALYRLGGVDRALDAYEVYLDQPYASKNEYYADAWYGMGWSELKLDRYEAAGRHFEKYIGLADRDKNREQYIDAILRAGDCEFALKNYNGALRYYKQVKDFNSMHVDYAMFQMGLLYFRLDEREKAATTHVELASRFRKSEFRDDALITASEIYLTWLDDWQNCAKYCKILYRDHKDSPYVPGALNRLAISEAKSNNREQATKYFKMVAYDYCHDGENLTIALTNLSKLLNAREYDQVEAQSREKCPNALQQGDQTERENLAIQIADKRFFSMNYESAEEKYTAYLQDFPTGVYRYRAMFNLAQTKEKLEQEEAALEYYARVYEEETGNEFTVKALKAAADLHAKRGNRLAAMELYTAAEEKADRLEDRLGAQFGKAEVLMANEDYAAAKAEYMGIYSDENTTDYSKSKAYTKIGVCEYMLGKIDDAFAIFSEIEGARSDVFAAESQYYICRILYDKADYEQSKNAVLYFNDHLLGYNHWKARAFLVLAENYLATGDTFQATKGTLKSLAEQDAFPDVKAAAETRIAEIEALKAQGNNRREREDQLNEDMDDLIKEEEE